MKSRRISLFALGVLTTLTRAGNLGECAWLPDHNGVIGFSADTSQPDPFEPNCYTADCFVGHATRCQNGKLTDLGAPPGNAPLLARQTYACM
jgi:hypothetical protein